MGLENLSPALQARLRAGREQLERQDLPAAIAIYEEILAGHGGDAAVLLIISGDLGSAGQVAPIVQLIAPLYDPERHGAGPGLNLLQAYLFLRDPESAQHILDLLFALNRPELEERLYGFANAISGLLTAGAGSDSPEPGSPAGGPPAEPAAKGAAISISKPIWYYGLEALAAALLPPKSGALRRIAFTQLATPGAYADFREAMRRPEDERGRLSRAIPLWLAETFYFTPHYAPIAAIAMVTQPDGARQQVVFDAEWTIEHMRQLVSTATDGLDYIFTGVLRGQHAAYELTLRVWDAKKFRERKQFTAVWTPATAEAELAKLKETVCRYMEWTPYPGGSGADLALPAGSRAWFDALGASLGLFLAGKGLLPNSLLAPLEPALASLAPLAAGDPVAALAWLTLVSRARGLGVPLDPHVAGTALVDHPLVASARQALGL